MRKILFLISWPLLLTSCKKEKIIEVEKIVEKKVEKIFKWKSHRAFVHNDVVQMNSYATNKRLYFLGQTSFSALLPDSINYSIGGNVANYENWFEQPIAKKFPICADYFISYDHRNGWVNFIPTINPVNSVTLFSMNIKNIDTTYSYSKLLHFSNGVCIAINEQQQALIPYFNTNSILKFALIDIKVNLTNPFAVKLDTIKTKIISIPNKDKPYFRNINALQSIGNYFFFSIDSEVYRVDSLGNIQNVLEAGLSKIINSSGTLFGFGNENNIYISSNDGLTWRTGYSIQNEFSWLNYTKIDNKIIGYRNDQLWEILVTETSLIAKELDNDGLDGISITSISKFDKKVFVSTLSGVYYRIADDFFDYKIAK